MSIPFATPEWVAAFKDAINASAAYREAAKTWEGDFWFIVEPEAGQPASERKLMYLDLWHGECREAFLAQDESERNPEFRIWAPAKHWRRVINREIDPIKALMTNQLKLKGNFAKIMRSVRAAQELVLCAASVPTQFD
ncbi:MAG: SCP2 sterol-binding domain-containing protein [Anaerolineae bacterium]|nr:SCP2 sterol-binding domain-containing protein [Candidatus Roseilinea sp.]MDW8450913.1 SCP2 sterol-binding domain-containing protein [Anaerolineae bacterium]